MKFDEIANSMLRIRFSKLMQLDWVQHFAAVDKIQWKSVSVEIQYLKFS